MGAALILVWAFFMTPVRLDLHVQSGSRALLRGRLDVTLWGITVYALPFFAVKNRSANHFILQVGKKRRPAALRVTGVRKKRGWITGFPGIKKHLKTWLSCMEAAVILRLGMPSAAATALTCGVLLQALNIFPFIHAQVRPQYEHCGYHLQIHCIAVFRLGKLCITAALLGAAWLARTLSGGDPHGNHQGSANQRSHANSP